MKGQIKPFLLDNTSFLHLQRGPRGCRMAQAWFGSTAYTHPLIAFEDLIERAKRMYGLSVLF